ncbi:MAG: arginine--tRNA ligase [Bacteroidales bacterium]|nr:arginine--tRNA ligase [Bacteroidales bacterium]
MIHQIIAQKVTTALKELYSTELKPGEIAIQKTRREFEGDITVVVFPITRYAKKSPQETADEIGQYLVNSVDEVEKHSVIKGFLNLTIANAYWHQFLKQNYTNERFGYKDLQDGDPVVIEYSSPNTNKPLHLGHIRNNLLGWSVAEILKANGKAVKKVNLVNDRGIHICKSMLAWQKWGEGETPESTGMKGDHLIGKYYVMFDKAYKEEIRQLMDQGLTDKEAAQQSELLQEAQDLLRKWEQGDQETVELWKSMNLWAYDGFDKTYERLGVDFDKIYYESETYLLGRDLVKEGLEKGLLVKKEDGSVWADLTDKKLDEKLLLRKDGTSVYMTQDLGTAQLRHDDFHPENMIYVVGNEQNYHFDVLRIILKKLGKEWADKIYHLSYGMVELPQGKMKSREGTVVDADDLLDEMYETAKRTTRELGKIEEFTGDEAKQLYNMVGLAALKYFILKVDPKKNMLFNPEESIDFNGNTGSFIQYTYARIQSVLRKAADVGVSADDDYQSEDLNEKENNLLKNLHDFPLTVEEAGKEYSPAQIANYTFEICKEFNQFYHDHSILKAETQDKVHMRLKLSVLTGKVIRNAMKLLGIDVPTRM